MALRELVTSVDGWESKTAAQLHTILAAMTKTVEDDQLYTWAGVALLIGPSNAEQLRIALESNGAGWAVHQLGGSGIQLSNVLTQGMLTAFIGAGLTFCETLKSQGIHTEPITDATESDVAAVLLGIQKESLLDAAEDRLQVYREALTAWNGSGNPPSL